ncbi:hypothetical protein BKA63DRAFT_427190 [Paraphoma chrysanthemicola]|nr:hypothetical protein BKA63DRAFT_427190 [Paraphoma chrysanthemicola]
MEALIAVGLAGNVVQFVQGAGALISVAKSMRKGGKCEDAGLAFIVYIDSLVSNSSSKVVGLAKTTIKLRWASPRIDEFVDKLDKLRTSLSLGTVLAFRTSAESSTQEILTHLREIQLDYRARNLDELGIQSTIQNLADIVQDQAADKLNAIKKEIQSCLREINSLRSEDVDFPYFINGKAGSGKSTLMKFILEHPRTKAPLKIWAGKDELVVLHFFFWGLGTPLQRSHIGMLRALLHAMLEKHPELIPAALPRLFRNWKKSDADTEPTYIELKKAFELMVEKCRFLKLAILIDGIDEFEGDHRDISLFFRSIVSPRIKIVVSSRPINSCLAVMEGCPTLKLQDLTRKDMESYVDGHISSHRLMRSLMQQYPDQAPQLSADIVDKAEGVFLWVKLVVYLLVEGLEDGDDLTELQSRLMALPSDLRDLYQRMFGKMQGDYQKQAAIIFQLLDRWRTVVPLQPLPGLVLSYATGSPLNVFGSSTGQLTNEVFDWTMSSLEKRIRSRCCGLLELRYNERTLQGWKAAMLPDERISLAEVNVSSVTYLHRTVAEFITMDEVWSQILRLTEESALDVNQNLASACLLTLKSAESSNESHVKQYTNSIADFCRTSTSMSPNRLVKYLEELDGVRTSLQKGFANIPTGESQSTQSHWSAADIGWHPRLQNFNIQHNIYTFAAGTRLFMHPIPMPDDLSPPQKFSIIIVAMHGPYLVASPFSLEERATTLAYLLRTLARSEGKDFEAELWHHAVLLSEQMVHDGRVLEAAQNLKVFLATSESPKSLCQHSDDARRVLYQLKSYLSRSRSRNEVKLLNELDRLSSFDDLAAGMDSAGTLVNALKRSRRSQSKGKQSRRSKKARTQNR